MGCPACASAWPRPAALWPCQPRRAAHCASTRVFPCEPPSSCRVLRMTASLRVALADDQALVRAGLRALLERQGIAIAFEADDGEQLLAQLAAQPVDVVLSDIRMPRVDGIEALQQL